MSETRDVRHIGRARETQVVGNSVVFLLSQLAVQKFERLDRRGGMEIKPLESIQSISNPTAQESTLQKPMGETATDQQAPFEYGRLFPLNKESFAGVMMDINELILRSVSLYRFKKTSELLEQDIEFVSNDPIYSKVKYLPDQQKLEYEGFTFDIKDQVFWPAKKGSHAI